MSDPKRRKPSAAVMARVLRNSEGATSPADLEARLHDLRPLQPSAEYVAAANEVLGREGAGPEMMGAVRASDQEHGGVYGALPLANGAAARLPVHLGPMPQGSLASAEAVARMGQQGVMSQDEARARGWKGGEWSALKGAKASASAVDPRLLAMALRTGR